jgi:hypothetical protein
MAIIFYLINSINTNNKNPENINQNIIDQNG